MTVKAKDLPKKNLNINEIGQNTPPISLELRSGKRGRPVSDVSHHIIKLVSRLLDMADEDYTILTPTDKKVLRDVLTYGSTEKVAQLQQKSDTTIRSKVNHAIDTLTRQMKVWQDPHKKLVELTRRIKELEQEIEIQQSQFLNLLHKCERLEEENKILKDQLLTLKGQQPTVDSQDASGLVKADKATTHNLNSCLEDINIPSNIADKLNVYDIKTIYDLVRLSEKHISRFRDISYSDLKRINRSLKKTGLSLGTDVRRIEGVGEYYIKKLT